jgi:flagellar motor switch protein FliG
MRLALLALTLLIAVPSLAAKPVNPVGNAQKAAEVQIRQLLEPLLEKYCHDECKLMSVSTAIDLAIPDSVAPGFDDVDTHTSGDLAPTSGRVKLLINEKVGPVSRRKVLDLIQQYLDTLDFPVKIDTQLTRFPEPIESSSKIVEMRERVAKQFKETLNDLFRQFCPNQCLLADFNLATEVVNGEEAQYGTSGEFVQDGGLALRIRDLGATILVDDTLTPEEQANILEMARLKTNSFKNVSLTSKPLKFPRPAGFAGAPGPEGELNADGTPRLGANGRSSRSLSSEKNSSDSRSTDSRSLNDSRNSQSQSQSKSELDQKSTSNHNSQTSDTNNRQDKYERFEKIERVEQGDAIQKELDKFKIYGLVFACSVLSLLIFVAVAGFRKRTVETHTHGPGTGSHRGGDAGAHGDLPSGSVQDSPGGGALGTNAQKVAKNYEIHRMQEELTNLFAQQPKVAKQVFSRILTEEGVETTAQYIHLFGEGVVVDMLRDPSLQGDLSELMEYFAKNPIELSEDETLDLLKRLHNRAIAGKLVVLGNRSSNLFDFLVEMDAVQIMELVRTESVTVKAIVITQCDPQKRSALFGHLDEETRMTLLTELSRIDYLPRDFIFNVSAALKRKRRENPRLNTEALPGSEVLINLLERTAPHLQKAVIRKLEISSPESVRTIKSKLVCIEALRHLRDHNLLEVILSLKHDELLIFLRGTPGEARRAILDKCPKDLTSELEEQLANLAAPNRDVYQSLERKIMNRMKIMANDGQINLVETNERMLSSNAAEAFAADGEGTPAPVAQIKKAAGW